ncbi:MAG TPA: efflux RND transporter periplasmic adaptor subunit [Steroidobacteraceae bacterium]|nr:efflux RND transporter periplasmic adaptor subunit [Steroidobacteraceae bacterium]
MRNRTTVFSSLLGIAAAAAAAALALSGCSQDQAAERAAPPPPPQVPVARVIARTITDSETFTGRFSAVHHVDVRPRVTGYISSVDFTDGSMVKKGQVLFVIDPRPYRAIYQEAAAQLEQAHSRLELVKSDQARAIELYAAHAVSREELDTRKANATQAEADVEAAKAALEQAALNLSFTRVTSPITGRVGRAIVTAGNLVTSGQTLLTSVVSLNPIYVSFNADEHAYLKFEKYAHDKTAGAVPTAADGGQTAPAGLGNAVYVGLEDENGYPHQGRLVFLNNSLDAGTGTIRARALLSNPDDVFVPGLFARVKLIGNEHYKAVLVNDSAIGTDQTVRYVLLVGKNDRIEYRPVELGPIVHGLRVVRSGLSPGDTIVVSGLMRVHPGMQVTPQLVAMGDDDETYSVMMAQNATHPHPIHLAVAAAPARQPSIRVSR